MPKVELPKTRTAYEQVGRGEDVVWIAGGGGLGADWNTWQVPAFAQRYRNTTFDNRGIGATECDEPLPWTIADFAADTAALIEAVCRPPVAIVGLSMGSLIVSQLALDRPDLVTCGIAMGTAATGSEGWLGDYMSAEIEFRKQGGRLSGMMSVTHYAAELYPAQALGDRATWERIKQVLGGEFEEENERSLIGQWQACVDFDVVARLPSLTVPMHVIAFAEDVQAPPQYGKQVADLAPTAEYHLLEGMGHCSLYGHKPDEVNSLIATLLARYLAD